MPTIAVSTLSLALSSFYGNPVNGFSPWFVKRVLKLNVGLQYVPQRGFSPYQYPNLPVEVIEKLLISPYLVGQDVGYAFFNQATATWPNAKVIDYRLQPDAYVHVSDQLFSSTEEALGAVRKGWVKGLVLDTCHSYESGLLPNSHTFNVFIEELLKEDLPFIVHIQPKRVPKGGKGLFTRSDWVEVMDLATGNYLSRLLHCIYPLKGIPDIPIVIELDPKLGFNPWQMLFLLREITMVVKNFLE